LKRTTRFYPDIRKLVLPEKRLKKCGMLRLKNKGTKNKTHNFYEEDRF